MTTVIVHHSVTDYDTWKPVFDEHGVARAANGCESVAIYRDAAEPNSLTVVTEWPSLDAAQAFVSDPALKEAMSRAGVTGPPEIHIIDLVDSAVGAGV